MGVAFLQCTQVPRKDNSAAQAEPARVRLRKSHRLSTQPHRLSTQWCRCQSTGSARWIFQPACHGFQGFASSKAGRRRVHSGAPGRLCTPYDHFAARLIPNCGAAQCAKKTRDVLVASEARFARQPGGVPREAARRGALCGSQEGRPVRQPGGAPRASHAPVTLNDDKSSQNTNLPIPWYRGNMISGYIARYGRTCLQF
jgi:hypothetical protein